MEYAKIKELCTFLPKSKIKAGEGLEVGKYIFFTSSDIKTLMLNEYLYDEEAIILGTGGKPSCNYFSGKFSVSTDNFVLTSDKIKMKYLYYFLRYDNLKVLENGFHGAGLKHISKDYVCDIAVPVFSIDKQINIINQLDLINRKIAICNEEIEILNNLIKSQFIEMFGNPLTNEKSFKKGKVGDYTIDIRYGTSKPADIDGIYPYLRMNNLTYDGYLDYSDLKFINLQGDELEKYSIKRGDVLFNRTNSIELIGKTACYLESEVKVIAGYIIRVRFNDEINPIYFTKYMNLPSTKKILQNI